MNFSCFPEHRTRSPVTRQELWHGTAEKTLNSALVPEGKVVQIEVLVLQQLVGTRIRLGASALFLAGYHALVVRAYFADAPFALGE